MMTTGVGEKRSTNSATPSDAYFSKCSFCKTNLLSVGVIYKTPQPALSPTNLLGCGHVLCTKCATTSLVAPQHAGMQASLALVKCACCKRVTGWTRFNEDGTLTRDLASELTKVNFSGDQTQTFLSMRRLGENIQKAKNMSDESQNITTDQRKRTSEVRNIISYHAYSIIMTTLGRYFQVMEAMDEEEKKLNDYVATIEHCVRESHRKLAVAMYIEEKTRNTPSFPDTSTRNIVSAELAEIIKSASIDTVNADKLYKQLKNRNLNVKVHNVKTKTILENLKCWVAEIESNYRFDVGPTMSRRFVPVFDSRRRWDPRIFTELADSTLLVENMSISNATEHLTMPEHNYIREFDELRKLNVLNIPRKISIFDKQDYSQKTNNGPSVEKVKNHSHESTSNVTTHSQKSATVHNSNLNEVSATASTSSRTATNNSEARPNAPVQSAMPTTSQAPPPTTTFINRPANGSGKPTTSSPSPQKEVRPTQDGPRRLIGAPPFVRPGGLTGAPPFTRPTLNTQLSTKSDDQPGTSAQRDGLKSPLYVVETNDSEGGNNVIPKIKIKLQKEPSTSYAPAEPIPPVRIASKPTTKPQIEQGKNYTEDGRELDDDGECKYCYFCNGESELEEEQGICNSCPRVFHAHCNMPPLRGTWEDTGDDWKCILCTKVDTQRALSTEEFSEQKRLLCYKVLSACYWDAYNVTPFKNPVKETKYRKTISTPMDFGLIAKKLNKKTGDESITSTKMFIDLMNLVFTNCSIFNEKDSDVAHAGQKVWNLYRAAVEKYLPIHKKDVWLYHSLHAKYKAQKRQLANSEKTGPSSKRKAHDSNGSRPTSSKRSGNAQIDCIKQEETSPTPQT